MSEWTTIKPVFWVIYDHPKDWPDYFVARKWIIMEGKFEALTAVKMTKKLDDLREIFYKQGLYRLNRFDDDDPCIIEVWV